MIKWLALWFAMLALFTAADRSKTTDAFNAMEARIGRIENKQCTLMVVLTPSGQTTICAQP